MEINHLRLSFRMGCPPYGLQAPYLISCVDFFVHVAVSHPTLQNHWHLARLLEQFPIQLPKSVIPNVGISSLHVTSQS